MYSINLIIWEADQPFTSPVSSIAFGREIKISAKNIKKDLGIKLTFCIDLTLEMQLYSAINPLYWNFKILQFFLLDYFFYPFSEDQVLKFRVPA